MYALLEIQKYTCTSPSVNCEEVSDSKTYIQALKTVKEHEARKKFDDYRFIQLSNDEPINENELKLYRIVFLEEV